MDQDSRARNLIKLAERFRSRKLGNVRKRLSFGDENTPVIRSIAFGMDSYREIVSQQAKELEKKYNFDFLNENPKKGELQWEKVEKSKDENIPEFYFRPPHQKRSAFRHIDLSQESSVTSSKDASGSLSLAQTTSSTTGSTYNNNNNNYKLQLSRVTSPTAAEAAAAATITTTTATRQLFVSETITSSSDSNRPSQCIHTYAHQQFTDSIPDVATTTQTLGDVKKVSPLVDSSSYQTFTSSNTISQNRDVLQIDPACSSFSIISDHKESSESCKDMEETGETPLYSHDGKKRKQITDYYQEKKKRVETIRRKLYEHDSDN